MSPLVRRLLMVLLAVVVIGAVVVAMRPGPVSVDLAEVSRGPMVMMVNEDGETRVRERYVVSAPLAGRLRRIGLSPGDPVERGVTVVAMIEPTDPGLLDPRARGEAQARVRAAEAALRRAGAVLDQARSELDFAENEQARVRDARTGGGASPIEVDRAERGYDVAAAAFRARQFDQEIAEFELEQARAALLGADGTPAEGTDDQGGAGRAGPFLVRAPISGRVLRIDQKSDIVVAPGAPLLELGDAAELEVVVDVLSVDAVRIVPGTRVVIEHWGGDEPLDAVVRVVEPSAFTKVSALGVEEQRVNVIADFVSPFERRPTLGDGYRVEAGIVLWESDDVVRVPTTALFRHEGGWALFAVEEGRARLTPIDVGHFGGTVAEVRGGAALGAKVIVHPSDRVADGVRVRERGGKDSPPRTINDTTPVAG